MGAEVSLSSQVGQAAFLVLNSARFCPSLFLSRQECLSLVALCVLRCISCRRCNVLCPVGKSLPQSLAVVVVILHFIYLQFAFALLRFSRVHSIHAAASTSITAVAHPPIMFGFSFYLPPFFVSPIERTSRLFVPSLLPWYLPACLFVPREGVPGVLALGDRDRDWGDSPLRLVSSRRRGEKEKVKSYFIYTHMIEML